MTDLDDLIFQLKAEEDRTLIAAAQHDEMAKDARQDASIIHARIQGIEEARAALRPTCDGTQWGDTVVLPMRRSRQPRRDIRALVKAQLESQPLNHTPEDIAARIGCRKSQVEAALKALQLAEVGGGEL